MHAHLDSRVSIHGHVRTADTPQITDPALIELNPFRWHVAKVETVTQENRRCSEALVPTPCLCPILTSSESLPHSLWSTSQMMQPPNPRWEPRVKDWLYPRWPMTLQTQSSEGASQTLALLHINCMSSSNHSTSLSSAQREMERRIPTLPGYCAH